MVQFCFVRLWALSIQPKISEITVDTSNRTYHLGLVRPKYSGPALKVIHFDRSGHFIGRFGRSDRHVPFHLTKLLFPLPLSCLQEQQPNAQWLGSGLCNWNVPSIGHVEFPKFQTGIFVE